MSKPYLFTIQLFQGGKEFTLCFIGTPEEAEFLFNQISVKFYAVAYALYEDNGCTKFSKLERWSFSYGSKGQKNL